MEPVTPYRSSESKKEQVAHMFNNIAFRYDFLNSLLSLGIHKGWRKKCVKQIALRQPNYLLDVATGTADFAIECMALHPVSIIGIDISEGMMKHGRQKIAKLGLEKTIRLHDGDAETCDLPSNSIDAITVGFGVRNFENLEKGLANMYRILKPGGQLCVLEFSYPRRFPVKQCYHFYFKYITPTIGRLFSKDTRAYSYLQESVKAFPDNEQFTAILSKIGYRNSSFQSLSFGIAAIYLAEK